MTERTFDRKVRFDPASRSFPISAVVGSDTPFIDKEWDCNAWLDQRAEGACVGFAWAHELQAEPEVVPMTEAQARAIYKRAQQLDVWPGEQYEGTSVLGGVKAVRELKNNAGEPYIKEYRWAFGLADLARAVGYQGPVVIGVNWYTGMFNTDANGFIRVTGSVAGGHSLLVVGVVVKRLAINRFGPITSLDEVDLDNSYIVLHNSWGRDWGFGGRAKISFRDMQRLLAEQGDACVPMVRVSDYVAPAPEPEPEVEDVVPVNPLPDQPTDAKYFATKRSKIYHDSHQGYQVFRVFDTEETAVESGFRPCRVCKP